MNGAQRDKVLFFLAKITKKKLLDKFPFVFSRTKMFPSLSPLQWHFNQSGEVSEEYCPYVIRRLGYLIEPGV